MTTETRVPDTKSEAYSFEDISKYDRVYYLDYEAIVIEKGSNVSSVKGEQIKIEYLGDGPSRANTTTLQKSLVNRYLHEQRKFWVDWRDHVGPYKDN